MRVAGQQYRSIERRDGRIILIDQTRLPHDFELVELRSLEDAAQAISNLVVRGAPLVGVTAAYGLALALDVDSTDVALDSAIATLLATRPTARNLQWALGQVADRVRPLPSADRAEAALLEADRLAEADVATNEAIGRHGAATLRQIWERCGCRAPLEIATHCNAGWLGCVDWGTALAAVYRAHAMGIPLHVWVDESRPVHQGSRLTAWELAAHGIPYTLQVDAASGSRLRSGRVHVCIVGADRVTAQGDVCNKIGTYLLALAAYDNHVPFYPAFPSSTFDPSVTSDNIEIEVRGPSEVTHVWGKADNGERLRVRVAPAEAVVDNPAFDVTPARLVTGVITERGVFAPDHLAARLLNPTP
jgi:methylthioribose-1-phosphate isomerase